MRIKEFYCPHCREFKSFRQTVHDGEYRRFCYDCHSAVQETWVLFQKLSDLVQEDPEAKGYFDATKE